MATGGEQELAGAQSQSPLCNVCLEEGQPCAAPCGCRFCSSCWYTYLFGRVMSMQVLNVPCMGCPQPLQVEFIESVLSVNNVAVHKFRRFQRLRTHALDPNCRWCPAVDCGEPLPGGSSNEPKLQCPLCQTYVCYLCNAVWHQDTPCADTIERDYQQWLRSTTSDSQKCPQCGIAIEKEEGCNHLSCLHCNHEFCWLCKKPYVKEHYDWNNAQGCPGMQFRQEMAAVDEAEVRRRIRQRQADERRFLARRVRTLCFAFLCLPLALLRCCCALRFPRCECECCCCEDYWANVVLVRRAARS